MSLIRVRQAELAERIDGLMMIVDVGEGSPPVHRELALATEEAEFLLVLARARLEELEALHGG
jgi:hypothetical protein